MDCTCVCVGNPKGGVLLLLLSLLFVRLEGDGDMLSLLFKMKCFFQSRCRSPSSSFFLFFQFSSYSRVSRTHAMGGRKPTASFNKKANKKNDVFIDLRPSEIYFTFSKLSDTFSGCSKTLLDTLRQLEAKEVDARKDIPAIAVVEIDKPHKKQEEEEEEEEEIDGKSNRKKKKKKKKKKDNNDNERIFVSMNNRRLWVYKEAEKRGILQTIGVRLQPKEVGERLARKGSRNFRLDRITLEARISSSSP